MADMKFNNAEYLVEKYLDDILRMALVHVRNMDDAEDIAQQVFVTYLSKKPVFESERHAKNWLLKVAVNKSRNHKRTNRGDVDFYELENVLSTDDTYNIQTDEQLAVFDAVMHLKDQYRDIVHLYYYEGYSTEEISKLLGISVSGVRSRMSRARKMLENILEGDEKIEGSIQQRSTTYQSE